jgi:cobalt-zinc-cadmium efflux system membrane fusion protein
MNPRKKLHYSLLVLLTALVLAGCGKTPSSDSGKEHADEEHSAEFERGPHNGRLLRDGNLAVEIAIFEDGVAPEFRVHATVANQPINPVDLQLNVELHRFVDVVDQLQFAARDGYLVSTATVYEPHSFDVVVLARYQGKSHRWTYSSYEGRTNIDAAAANAAGIAVAAAGPGTIEERIALYGTIQPDATRVRAVAARFPGAIRSMDVAVGESVRAGQRLAQVESNESLQTYVVTAPIAGIVTQRRGNPGETTDTAPLFEIVDHSQVWVVLNVFPRDRGRIGIGQSISVQAADGEMRGMGTIAAISAGTSTTASITARVVLDNRNGQWTPGQFVDAQATAAKFDAPLVVPVTALQRFRFGDEDGDAVFLNRGDGYQAQPVAVGRRDGEHVEIIKGLTAGMPVVVANSYLVKADIEKSGASHDH